MKLGIIDAPIGWLSDLNWAMFAVIMVSVWKLFPFIVIAVLGILQSIPTELYEAARIDGAGPFRRFFKITFPYILPVFLLSSLLSYKVKQYTIQRVSSSSRIKYYDRKNYGAQKEMLYGENAAINLEHGPAHMLKNSKEFE